MGRYDTPAKKAKHAEEQRRYRRRHPEIARAGWARYEARHLEKMKRQSREFSRIWRQTSRGKELSRRNHAKYRRSSSRKKTRKREMAKRRGLPVYFMLNGHFEGAELHHAERNIGIWLPMMVHRSLRHDLLTGRNMVAINEAAADWLNRSHRGEGE